MELSFSIKKKDNGRKEGSIVTASSAIARWGEWGDHPRH